MKGTMMAILLFGASGCILAPPQPNNAWSVVRPAQPLGACAVADAWVHEDFDFSVDVTVRLESSSDAACFVDLTDAALALGARVVRPRQMPPKLRIAPASSVFVLIS